MKDNQAKYPQLRFKGFTDPWEQRKLGEEAQLTMGQSPNSENYTKNPDDYILVQGNADMKNGRVVPRVWTTQVTKKAEKSDLILSVRAPVGDIGKTDYDVVLGRGVAAIKGNEFIFQQLGKMKLTGYWTRYSTGSTFESINSNDIKDAKIMVPVEEEQQKIGSFFQQLDHLITLHQRKLAKLKELKQGYLQKLFPENGSKFPQLRFAGFADAWEERKLGDITKISTGKLDANAMVENGKYDFYTSGIKKYRIDVAAFEGPSITIAGNGATVGYMHLADNKFNAYQRTYVLQEFLVDRSFIFSEIGNKLPKKIKQEARTGNIPYIVMDMLTELKLSIPQNNSEQQKIGSFFKQLDDTIDLHQRKLEKLQELKKGYLQKMFC